ncbi:MAG: THUMP domain-containing class I SAM-dependent RNA methyltransferase [Hyphomicrobiales bacterium]
MTISPLEKRIKRHVVGKPHDFFAVTAPGFEELCRSELAALGLNGRAVVGGVEFNGRLHECYLANLSLRTASRVLLRAHSFQAVHFSELEKRITAFAWELYLKPGSLQKIHVTTHHCRLHHTDAIAERIRNGIERRLSPLDESGPTAAVQQVFVRGRHDRFTVSIDSSGENLYLRGIKTHPGIAPLRETIAAAALMRGGFTGAQTLLDPMCGTGTFSLEAALIAKNIPPGWFREFAFASWPGFRSQRWDHLRRKTAERFSALSIPRIFASDLDPEACGALEKSLRTHGLSDAVAVTRRDFFELVPRDLTERPGVVVINPPYGRRLGRAAEGRELIRAIIARIQEHYQGWKFILVAPAGRDWPATGSSLEVYPVFHGGLSVNVIVGNVIP